MCAEDDNAFDYVCVTEYAHDSVMCVCHKVPDGVQFLMISLYDLCNENSLNVYVC